MPHSTITDACSRLSFLSDFDLAKSFFLISFLMWFNLSCSSRSFSSSSSFRFSSDIRSWALPPGAYDDDTLGWFRTSPRPRSKLCFIESNRDWISSNGFGSMLFRILIGSARLFNALFRLFLELECIGKCNWVGTERLKWSWLILTSSFNEIFWSKSTFFNRSVNSFSLTQFQNDFSIITWC